jgi:IS30 family transposase
MFQFTILMTKLELKGLKMYKHLTYSELCTIWHNKVNKSIDTSSPLNRLGVDGLAKLLEKHRSTIYRAINYIKSSGWRPDNSLGTCIKFRRRKHKSCKLEAPKVKKYIEGNLEIGWSPEVISGRIYSDIRRKISFKTIYLYTLRS